MKKIIFFLSFLVSGITPSAGQYYHIKADSLWAMLHKSAGQISHERIDMGLEWMGRIIPDQPGFDSLKNILIEETEASRDRLLICKLYYQLAALYLNYTQRLDYAEKGKSYADLCMRIATESGLNLYRAGAMMNYTRYYLTTSQNQKALDFSNQVISVASVIGSDSLMAVAYDNISNTYYEQSNRISQFQSLLNKRDFAERSGVEKLIAQSYFSLGTFYLENDDYEKAKDLFTSSIFLARKNNLYIEVYKGLRALASTYLQEKDETLGVSYYNKALQYADSVGMTEYKLPVYFDLLNYYFNADNPEKGFAYLNSHPQIMEFIRQFGIEYQVNKLYAAQQIKNGHYDSALYYLKLAAPKELGQKGNFHEKYNFSIQLAGVYELLHHNDERKKVLLLARTFADSAQELTALRDVSLNLDSAYLALGDYKNANAYLIQYNQYRDSLETLSKQKDLLNIEIENANKRAEQEKISEESAKRQRNNVQYLGITAAIASIFIILVVLGVFKMSPSIIKALGFFAFIFLFEFIVLLLDEQIHELTGGEPWKVLGIKIVIIAMLLPLHHTLEEKTLHYLTSKAHKLRPKIHKKEI